LWKALPKEKEKQELLEIERFSKLYRHDARPTQPLYDRIVQESE
jgi:carbonic anhydrase